MTPMIELKKVTKAFGDVVTFRDQSLEIADNEFIAVVGPSGSGKTTLLNLTAGLLKPTSGEVVINGQSLYHLDPQKLAAFRRQNFGFVFQTFNLIPYLTARENVEVPLCLAGWNGAGAARASELLERVGLKDKAGRFPAQLSTGEQQRVAVARALANQPKVVFADEPTGNLDPRNREEFMTCVRELHGQGVTILMVTHDPILAQVAEKQITIIDGRIQS